MGDRESTRFTIVGGGLAGALMAAYLGKAGYEVEVYEMRGDARQGEIGGGRSINLALSHRGIRALEHVGLAGAVLRHAIPMRGRMIHGVDGALSFQPYGTDERQVINSVSRNTLNAVLLDGAASYPSVRLHFHQKCTAADLERPSAEMTHVESGERCSVEGDVLLGADGAFSAVRLAMQKRDGFDFSQDYLAHGYKELTIPAGADGGHRMEKHALHIWPRRSFMMIALPNLDGSFTCTLFWPLQGRDSFASVETEKDLLRFFQRHFPDALPLMPDLTGDYFHNPVGSLVTIRCRPWHVEDRVVLIGDACHAVVPFYGQGMNAAFEDVLVLGECLDRHRRDRGAAFRAYEQARKADVDTLAELAVANFIEMRDRTGSRLFLLQKRLERELHHLFPRWYVPLYSMVTFTRMPYAAAVRRARLQNRMVRLAAAALLALFALALAALIG